MRDLIFIAIVVAFFTVAVAFVWACEVIVAGGSPTEEERER